MVENVFQMTCQCAACIAVEHQVLRQDTGEISPGKGRDRGRRKGESAWGSWRGGRRRGLAFSYKGKKGEGGLISRLCVHFFLGFASRGRPISLPRSFSPVHDRIKYLLMNMAEG